MSGDEFTTLALERRGHVLFQSEDHREALAALRDRRPPAFTGR